TCVVNNCTLREAIIDAANGETIAFDPALQGQTITLTGGELLITKTLTISGPGASLLAVSGNGTGRVFNIAASGVVTITNLTVQDGRVNSGNGGGILDAGQLLLVSVTLTNNVATGSGGGIFVWFSSSQLRAQGGLVRGNSAGSGGGLFVESGTAILTSTQVISNSANYGGGIRVNQPVGVLTLTNGLVERNTGVINGGGLFVQQGTATLNSTDVLSNSATNGGGVFANQGTATLNVSGGTIGRNTVSNQGGGLHLFNGTATLTGTNVLSNSAHDGGGLYLNQGTARLNVTGGTIGSNTATNSGGGLYVNQGEGTLSNTNVLSNSATNGGGVWTNQGTATLNVSGGTIGSNTATGSGGGVYNFQGAMSLTSTTLERNTANASGGGMFLKYGSTVLTNTQILSNNTKIGSGGGLFLQNSSAVITMTGGQMSGNTVPYDGGGLYLNSGRAVFTGTHLLNNRTMRDWGRGGAIFAWGASSPQITNSCIVNNSDISVELYGSTKPATGNWWGAADGPAGAGPGSGDSVSGSVDYSGFKTTPPAGCPNRLLPTADAGVPQSANPGITITLNGSASNDPVGDGLTYGWRQTGGVTVTLSSATTVSPTFTAPITPTVLSFTLTITDGLHRADTATTTVTIANNTYYVYLPLIIAD
ncbi:MAG: hypothetical protein D6768_07295, partial [Chloroflexi bacterium]